jgi:cytochrome c oxidase subunit 3
METEVIKPKNKIHPHKFTLWVGIGSIVMMFAGLTSAYIVKRNQAGWVTYDLPRSFWYSTLIIIFSSITLQLSAKAFKERAMSKYRMLILSTLILGVLFIVLQFMGFKNLYDQGLDWKSHVSVSFFWVIVLLHAAHVIGGIIALIVMFLKAFSTKTRIYSLVPIDLICTYWHFVDVLWIYLLIFIIMIK